MSEAAIHHAIDLLLIADLPEEIDRQAAMIERWKQTHLRSPHWCGMA